jgi:Ca2+-binding EF-hand superfamily protein
MSSKFAKQYVIPPEFPDILKDFTREVLRNQPSNVNEFAAKYFECLASGLPSDMEGGYDTGANDNDPNLDEVEAIILELFRKYDKDDSKYLDKEEFKLLMEDLRARLDFPKNEILRFLAEADMNADGKIEYEEFIPLAMQIIQGMYAKKRLEQHTADIEREAEELLVHGMSREELTGLVHEIFTRMDHDRSGKLSKNEFITALTSMELGLTRREINSIMFHCDQDADGNIDYNEFEPFAYDLLQKLISMRLLETELENDELGQYLMDLFKAKDVEMVGLLSWEAIRDVLHQAMLGLSMMQIYTVISEAENQQSGDGTITYAAFVPRAVGMIKSMLSFEKSVSTKYSQPQSISDEAATKLFAGVEDAFPSGTATAAELIAFLEASGQLQNSQELQTIKQFLSQTDSVVITKAKNDIWQLLKQLRRTKAQA